MSFSGKVKEELARNISSARHCQIAELTAFIGMCGTVVINSFDRCSIKIRTENILVARKVFTLIEKTFNIMSDISVRRNIKKQTETYSVIVKKHEDAIRILQATKMIGEQQEKCSSTTNLLDNHRIHGMQLFRILLLFPYHLRSL